MFGTWRYGTDGLAHYFLGVPLCQKIVLPLPQAPHRGTNGRRSMGPMKTGHHCSACHVANWQRWLNGGKPRRAGRC